MPGMLVPALESSIVLLAKFRPLPPDSSCAYALIEAASLLTSPSAGSIASMIGTAESSMTFLLSVLEFPAAS